MPKVTRQTYNRTRDASTYHTSYLNRRPTSPGEGSSQQGSHPYVHGEVDATAIQHRGQYPQVQGYATIEWQGNEASYHDGVTYPSFDLATGYPQNDGFCGPIATGSDQFLPQDDWEDEALLFELEQYASGVYGQGCQTVESSTRSAPDSNYGQTGTYYTEYEQLQDATPQEYLGAHPLHFQEEEHDGWAPNEYNQELIQGSHLEIETNTWRYQDYNEYQSEMPANFGQQEVPFVDVLTGAEASTFNGHVDAIAQPGADFSTYQQVLEPFSTPLGNAIEGAYLPPPSFIPAALDEVRSNAMPQVGPIEGNQNAFESTSDASSGRDDLTPAVDAPQNETFDLNSQNVGHSDDAPSVPTPKYTTSVDIKAPQSQSPPYHYPMAILPGTFLTASTTPKFLPYHTVAASPSVEAIDVPKPTYSWGLDSFEHPSTRPSLHQQVFGTAGFKFKRTHRTTPIKFVPSYWDCPVSENGTELPTLRKLNPGQQPAHRGNATNLVWVPGNSQYGYPQNPYPGDEVSNEGAGTSAGGASTSWIGASSQISPSDPLSIGASLSRTTVWKSSPCSVPLLLCEKVHGAGKKYGWDILNGNGQALDKNKTMETIDIVFKWPGYDNYLSMKSNLEIKGLREHQKVLRRSELCQVVGKMYLEYLQALARLDDVNLSPEFAMWRLSRDGGVDGGITPEMVFIKDIYEAYKGAWHVTAAVYMIKRPPYVGTTNTSGLQADEFPNRGPPGPFI